MAYIEMLESGFTRVGEFHYLHHDRDGTPFTDRAEMSTAIAAASADTGIALTLLPVFYAHAGFGAKPTDHSQRRFRNDLNGFARLLESARTACRGLDDAVVGVAPHSLRAVSPAEIISVADMAAGGPVHIHIAEQMREVEDCIAWSGQRPVDWLLGHAHVGENWCLVHATHITDRELQAIATSGATVGLCPITEANLGDGVFPADAFVDCGGRYGIGSDSNVLIDAMEEMRLLEYGQRLSRQSRNILAGAASRSTGEAIYSAAVVGGARACGVQAGIAAGLPADLVTLSHDHSSFIGRHGATLLDSLVFSAGRAGIDAVWRRGKKLVSGGRHRHREPIAARYRDVLTKLLQ
jgi:formiminoglutamate deiminase